MSAAGGLSRETTLEGVAGQEAHLREQANEVEVVIALEDLALDDAGMDGAGDADTLTAAVVPVNVHKAASQPSASMWWSTTRLVSRSKAHSA